MNYYYYYYLRLQPYLIEASPLPSCGVFIPELIRGGDQLRNNGKQITTKARAPMVVSTGLVFVESLEATTRAARTWGKHFSRRLSRYHNAQQTYDSCFILCSKPGNPLGRDQHIRAHCVIKDSERITNWTLFQLVCTLASGLRKTIEKLQPHIISKGTPCEEEPNAGKT